VLDTIEDERLVEHAGDLGARLAERLRELGLEVRAAGLLVGVQLEDGARAVQVVDRLREDGILVGRTGKADDVLKIRPPLVFADEHAELLAASLERALAG
jgi:4-aminobutyrate aminotransferase-like enzyme